MYLQPYFLPATGGAFAGVSSPVAVITVPFVVLHVLQFLKCLLILATCFFSHSLGDSASCSKTCIASSRLIILPGICAAVPAVLLTHPLTAFFGQNYLPGN